MLVKVFQKRLVDGVERAGQEAAALEDIENSVSENFLPVKSPVNREHKLRLTKLTGHVHGQLRRLEVKGQHERLLLELLLELKVGDVDVLAFGLVLDWERALVIAEVVLLAGGVWH